MSSNQISGSSGVSGNSGFEGSDSSRSGGTALGCLDLLLGLWVAFVAVSGGLYPSLLLGFCRRGNMVPIHIFLLLDW